MSDEDTFRPLRAPTPDPPAYVPIEPDAAELAMLAQREAMDTPDEQ
jgi:hypothetical protein